MPAGARHWADQAVEAPAQLWVSLAVPREGWPWTSFPPPRISWAGTTGVFAFLVLLFPRGLKVLTPRSSLLTLPCPEDTLGSWGLLPPAPFAPSGEAFPRYLEMGALPRCPCLGTWVYSIQDCGHYAVSNWQSICQIALELLPWKVTWAVGRAPTPRPAGHEA